YHSEDGNPTRANIKQALSRTISRVPCSENMENDNGEHNVDPINFGQEGNPPNEELELDDLLSSFQLLSDKAANMKPLTAKKRKEKNTKINLLVGDTSCLQIWMSQNDDEGINNERQLRKTGELVGFSFDQVG
ncbi:hypothetical protein Tco_1433314, partial [Tanacetum coccineum]